MALALLIAMPPCTQAGQVIPTGASSSNLVKQRQTSYEAYILGPGDALQMEVLDIPELSASFTIGPDGTIYLPRLRSLYVEGLTIEELRYFLTQQFKAYVKTPHLFLKPIAYRPVQVYVGGEIARPGYYTLSSGQKVKDQLEIPEGSAYIPLKQGNRQQTQSQTGISISNNNLVEQGILTSVPKWPTLFDAIRAARGVTPYSSLENVQVVRRQPLSSGGGKLRATVDFWRLVSTGDQNVNIRLFDGDVITVARSPNVLRDQLLAASRSNLSPDFIEVYVSGRVKEPGARSIPQGSTLNQAIASAGGAKLLRGQVEFLRFSPDGGTDRRLISLNNSAQAGDYKNPVLMNGDVIRVNDSMFSAGLEVLNEVSVPLVGIYSVYSLFKPNY